MAGAALVLSPSTKGHRKASALVDPRVTRVMSIVTTRADCKLTLPDLASETGLSVSRICHLFKIHTGSTPARYLKQFRIERARELLEATFLSVKEICARVGLNDVSHFVRDFEKTYGLSPSRYRMRIGIRD